MRRRHRSGMPTGARPRTGLSWGARRRRVGDRGSAPARAAPPLGRERRPPARERRRRADRRRCSPTTRPGSSCWSSPRASGPRRRPGRRPRSPSRWPPSAATSRRSATRRCWPRSFGREAFHGGHIAQDAIRRGERRAGRLRDPLDRARGRPRAARLAPLVRRPPARGLRTAAVLPDRVPPTAGPRGRPPRRPIGAGILRAMRLSHLFFTTLRDDPSEAEMPSHRLLLRAGYVRQLGSGLYSLLPLGFRVTKRVEQVIREEINAIGGQEMEMPVNHPAELWKESRPLRRDRARARPVQGPRRPRHGHRDDPRGGRRRPAPGHREELPPAADDRLPLPDEVPRRAPVAGRPRPRPRVRDEGLVQLRPRRRRPRRRLLGPSPRLHPHLRAPRARGDPRQLRRRDDGRLAGPRVHGPQPRGRGRARPLRVVRLRRQPPDRADGRARSRPRGGPPGRGGRDARHDDDRCAGRLPRRRHVTHGEGDLLRHRRRPVRRRDRPRRLRRQRDEARQRHQGDRRPAARAGRRDHGPRHAARLRLADRCPGRRRRRRRARREEPEPRRGRQPRRVCTCGT